MGDPYPYGLLDFQQLIAGRNHHDHLTEPPCVGGGGATSGAAAPLLANNHNDVVFSHGFASTTFTTPANPTVTAASALANHGITVTEKEWVGFDDMGNNNRWPRQETLSLLEIRSRLDSKFRETNHKAPLWNQISRMMSEEYGYQRSGKKCKEKFENLYKYYKKTKEGKAGRQDGKHYRFFRQLEAICGESSSTTTTTNNITTANYYQPPLMTFTTDGQVLHHNNNINKYCSSKCLSLSNKSSSDHQFETSSSENNNDDIIKHLSPMSYMTMMKQKQVEMEQKRDKRKSLRVEVEDIVECHMKKMVENQEAWMEKMMSVVEHREQEMVCKEQERMRDSIRFDQQVHQLWAEDRAWVATRDTALMDVVKKHLGNELITTHPHHYQPMVVEEYEEEPQSKNNMVGGQIWRSQI